MTGKSPARIRLRTHIYLLIVAFHKNDYHPKWSLIRRLIRRRADGVCERCGIRNQSVIVHHKNGSYRRATGCEKLRVVELRIVHGWTYRRSMKYVGLTKIHLAVAHLDRAHNQFTNLGLLCQRCHILHDVPQRVRNRF